MTDKITDTILRDFNMRCSENGLFLTKVLGEGSFGRVYSGTRSMPYMEDTEKKNQYAVKLTLDLPDIHEHLEREIRIQQELSHPNIVKIYQNQTALGYKIIVMEQLDMSLYDYLMRKRDYSLPESETREFVQQIVSGILCIHDHGYAHRDLKPENVLMKKDPSTGKWILKICDFGFAKESNNLVTGLGTPNYMAPEIFVNPQHSARYGPEVDLWALGAMVYFMLTGRFSFTYRGEGSEEVLIQTRGFRLPEGCFSPSCQLFVSQLLTTHPAHRMTFDGLRRHPFLLNPVSVTFAVPGAGPSPPVFHTVTVSNDRLPSADAVPWRVIADAAYKTLESWGCCTKEGVVDSKSIIAFTSDGEWIDLDKAVLVAEVLKERPVCAFMTFCGAEQRVLPQGRVRCLAAPTDLSSPRALITAPFAAASASQSSQSSQSPTPAELCAYRRGAAQCAEIIARMRDTYHFAVGQCATAHRCIALLERTCKGHAALLERALQGAVARVEACSDVAGRAFLYALVPRDTAEIRDFNSRGRDVLQQLCSLEGSFRRYAAFDDLWAAANVAPLAGAVDVLAGTAAAFDAELAAVLDTFAAYWNTLAGEIAALPDITKLYGVARAIAGCKDAAELAGLAADYATLLTAVAARFPTWAVRPCSSAAGAAGAGVSGGGGGCAQTLLLPSGAAAAAEYQRKIEALKKEKERLEKENAELQKRLEDKLAKFKI